MRAVVVGASGGIGGEFVRQLSARADVEQVLALSRSGKAPVGPKIEAGRIDLEDEASIDAAFSGAGEVGLVIVATGILSDTGGLSPEKTYRAQSPQAFDKVFRVNTIGPALTAKHALPRMPRAGRAVFAALSARVGSISDNGIGGWHAYRASKAALNMLIRNYAIEQARRNSDFICVGLHPGTVDTELSKPFQGNVPEENLFTPERSARCLLNVIDGLRPTDTGKVFDWAGQEIPA